ncbi:DNA-directed RNA polymerases I and III subunit RPAC2 [Blastocystis sp. ATCC 50177/Nand II]|uniref:DNA-directed RNA polymerases I and III subunit RPAC2 n=1 Tax=Blastocystis sp. subtype 1 (strain ATCC 50177 / NandII) TaxID=478820 RepID=A0A196SG13_BLAHN|nr:DNA-directed RNA polymerases I and III subunit RPAC2 [Blastocystis sp. ATCC 50177/Nand II]
MAEEKTLVDHKVELGVGMETARTFVFYNEGHTLGNPMRTILMQQDGIEFCGYSVPHPVEAKMHLRIQTTGESATKALVKGLHTFEHICDVIGDRYEKALH